MSMLFVIAAVIYNNYGLEWTVVIMVPQMCLWATVVAQDYHWYK